MTPAHVEIDERVAHAIITIAHYGRVSLASLRGYLRKHEYDEREIDRALQRLRKRGVITWHGKVGWKPVFTEQITESKP